MKMYALIIFILLFFLASCSIVPITGRNQLILIPDSSMNSMSFQQYGDFLKKNKTSTNKKKIRMVKRVGGKIQKAVEKYFAEKGISEDLQGYEWEFNLIENKDVNAWCMPGGKVVVYTGILPIARDETGLAVVMGHEIAHAIAKHGSERMSQGLIAQMGGMALSAAIKEQPGKTQQLWMTAFGLGAQYGVILPYSRTHETEADRLGLVFMAMAGYDPHEAVGFWQRMSEEKGGKAPPEFMSTHPSDETRINKIKEAIPEAMTYYGK